MSGATPTTEPEFERLEGQLERIKSNGRDGWIVGVVRDSATSERVTVVGEVGEKVTEGSDVRLLGSWTTHAQWGKQFAFKSAELVVPSGSHGVKKWIAKYIDGIGVRGAEKLVEAFGAEGAVKVLEERAASDDDPLLVVAGLSADDAARARASYAALSSFPEAQLWLATRDVVGAFAGRLVKKWKGETPEVLTADPYRPMFEVDGFGWKRCDDLAKKLGVGDHDPRRARAAVHQAFADQAQEGHVFLAAEELHAALARDFSVPIDAGRQAVTRLLLEGAVVEEGRREPRLYATALRDAEASVCYDLLRLIADSAMLAPLLVVPDPSLNDEQQAAVELVAKSGVTILTGGPGTGKSHTLRAILRVVPGNVILAAPTGKAAKRMTQATGRPALTIHRALEFGPAHDGVMRFQRNRDKKLDQMVVVIDEFSMVDVELAASLFAAIKSGARVVLVGDVDQLPSVGPGLVLRDLIDSGLIPVVRLLKNMRSAEGGAIATCAAKVIRGEQLDDDDLRADVRFLAIDNAELAAGEVVRLVAAAGKANPDDAPTSTMGLVRGYDLADVQVLCPQRVRTLGADAINVAVQAEVNPLRAKGPAYEHGELEVGDTRFRPGDKVIVVKNDYDLGVFNGDTGRVSRVDIKGRKLRVQLDDDRSIVFQKDSLRILHLAYAITVHKSQGSEYRAVVLPVHSSNSFMLQRNLLYTALTRARERVFIVGDRKGLSRAIRNLKPSERNTSLFARIKFLASEAGKAKDEGGGEAVEGVQTSASVKEGES